MLRESADRPLQQMVAVGYEANGMTVDSIEVANRQATEVAEAVVASGKSFCWTGKELIPASQCACTTGVPDPELISTDNGDRTMGMPLVIQDHVAGSLVLSMDGDSTWLTPHDLSLLRTVARQLSLAVANAMLYKEVRTREALRGELLHQVVSAQEQERQRIARDLHGGA